MSRRRRLARRVERLEARTPEVRMLQRMLDAGMLDFDVTSATPPRPDPAATARRALAEHRRQRAAKDAAMAAIVDDLRAFLEGRDT